MIDKYTIMPTNRDENRKMAVISAVVILSTLIVALMWKGG